MSCRRSDEWGSWQLLQLPLSTGSPPCAFRNGAASAPWHPVQSVFSGALSNFAVSEACAVWHARHPSVCSTLCTFFFRNGSGE